MNARRGGRPRLRGRGAWVTLAGLGLLVGGASAASAYWTVSTVVGPGSAAMARAAVLSAPVSATATESASGTVSVAWVRPASQLAGAGYAVTRTQGPGSPVLVCTVPATTGSCPDSALGSGTPYAYEVRAVVGTSWQSAAATATVTTLGVGTTSLPSGTVGLPYSAAPASVGGSGPYSWSLSSGTLPSWASLDPATGTISGTPSTAGTTAGLRLTVTDSAGLTATSAPLALTVAIGSQSVSFTSTPPASAVAGVTTYTPTAVATSGLAVALSIDASATSVCTISAGVVSFTTTGTCVIDADQPGSADYAAAARVQQSVVVVKLGQSVSFGSSPPSPAPAGTTYTPVVTATSGLPVVLTVDPTSSSVCTITSGVVSLKAIGTCLLNADQPGNATYDAAVRVQQSFTVVQGPQTVSFDIPIDAGVGGSYTPVVTATSGLTPTLAVLPASATVCRLTTGGAVQFLATGSCALTADQAGDANFSAAPQVMQSFTVSTPAGLRIVPTGGTGTPVVTCGAVSANRTCNVTGVGLSGSVTFSVVVVSSAGDRVVYSYTSASTVTETGQNVGTATLAAGTSISATTLAAGHVGNAPKTSVLTLGGFRLTITVNS
jgi:large repetitive protein